MLFAFVVLILFFINTEIEAQDLDPRAYARIPVNTTLFIAGFGYSQGSVVTDPTLPIKDLKAKIESPSLGVGHSFGLFGKTAMITGALPYAFAQASGVIGEDAKSITRSGFSDMRLRFSFLFHGAPAMSPADLAKYPKKTILGASLSVIAPTGQFFPEKLINLGTNRWSIKPELGISQPIGKRWLLDVYAGIWIFTTNYSFYPGNTVRKQDPMGSFQAHISYNITPRLWAAINTTFYTGGTTTVNNVDKNDRQSNSRVGATMVVPVGKKHSLKFAVSRGVIIRYGANFTSVSLGWQTYLFGR